MSSTEDLRFSWWLRAGDDAQLSSSIDRLAEGTGQRTSAEAPNTLGILVRSMQQPGMVVFDDAPSWATIKPYIDVCGPSKVIVTTNEAIPDGHVVDGLTISDEVVAFVASRGGISTDEARALIEATDGRPLLLLHATQFISVKGSTVSAYLRLLEAPNSIFERWPYEPPDYQNAQARIIPLSLVQLIENSDDWRLLGAALAALSPGPIPLSLLQGIADSADDFIRTAASSFVLVRNVKSRTVEVPSLIRHSIAELSLLERRPDVRETLRRHIGELAEDDQEQLSYLAEHLEHLGRDSTATVPAIKVASKSKAGQVATSMWLFAYSCSKLGRASVHSHRIARLAVEASWHLMTLGRPTEAEEILGSELAMANEAGCIQCRAPLLHIWGHLAELRYRPQSEDRRAFLASAAAMRLLKQRDAEYLEVLLDVIASCTRDLESPATLDLDEVPKLLGMGASHLAEAESLIAELSPVGGEELSADHIRRFDGLVSSWDEISGSHSNQSNSAFENPPPPSKGWTVERAVRQIAYHLLPSGQTNKDMKIVLDELARLPIEADDARQGKEEVDDLKKANGELRANLLARYGDISSAIAVCDFVDMILAHMVGDEKEAASACRLFVRSAILATEPRRVIPFVSRGLSFDIPEDLSSESVAYREYEILSREIPWFSRLADVAALAWIAEASKADSTPPPPKQAVYRALHEISGLGPAGWTVAALFAHMYSHRKHLSLQESLRFHRISVGLYRCVGVGGGPGLGYALYCYAHKLLDSNLPDAAERRFREAREILTVLDNRSDAVLHIDEHLASENAPYLIDEAR